MLHREMATQRADLPHAYSPVMMELAHADVERCAECGGLYDEVLHRAYEASMLPQRASSMLQTEKGV